MAISRAWAFQRSFVRKVWNKEISDWFKDIPADALPSNLGGRQSARAACLIGANDSIQVVILKVMTFERLKQAITLLPKVTGQVYSDIDETFEHRPTITMRFLQDLDAVPVNDRPVSGRISFKLVNETSQTINETKLQAIAKKIKDQFALNNGHIWKKGKNKVLYLDKGNGLDLRILCLNEADGKELVQKVCNVIDTPFDADKLVPMEPKRKSVTKPVGTESIMGRRVNKRKWRPTANVRFLYATAKISGLDLPVPLVDRSRQFFQAYEYL